MSEIQTLQSSLRSIINIRSKTAEIMKLASDGMTTKHGEEGKEKKFLSELKLQLDTINTQMKDLVCLHCNLTTAVPWKSRSYSYFTYDKILFIKWS